MSLRKKKRKLLRWMRWEGKVGRIAGPYNLAARGTLRAMDAHAVEASRKNLRKERDA